MRRFKPVRWPGLFALLLLLGALAGTVGLSGWAWLVGLASGVVITVLPGSWPGAPRHGGARTGQPGHADPGDARRRRGRIHGRLVQPAHSDDDVPGARPSSPWSSTPSTGGSPGAPGTTSPLGARFDMEVDAFLILVLSVYVGRTIGAWVLAIGVARYAFVAARVAGPVAARAAAAALLVQGRGRDPGRRAGGGGSRRAASPLGDRCSSWPRWPCSPSRSDARSGSCDGCMRPDPSRGRS